MGGLRSKRKGASGEREAGKVLAEMLGLSENLQRNLGQARAGGCDHTGLSKWAIEVKRQETLALGAWWKQAQEQADALGRMPLVMFRQNNKPWRFLIPASLLGNYCGIFGYVECGRDLASHVIKLVEEEAWRFN